MSGTKVAGGGTSSVVGTGYQGVHTPQGDFNPHNFLMNQKLGRISTMKLVKVMKVDKGDGELAMAGTVSVQPLVNQVDGGGNQQEHGTVHNLQYFRMQGGKSAIIHDPKVGDIGYAVIADRDSSAAIAARGKANPGSGRRFSPSDGVYMGGILNDTPTQYIKFKDDDSVQIVSPKKVDCKVGDLHVQINEDFVILGNPDKPLFNVTTAGGDSLVVKASLIK